MMTEENKSTTSRDKIVVAVHHRSTGENKNQNLRGRNSKWRCIRFSVVVFCGLVLFARLSWILFQRPGPVRFDSIIVTEQKNVSAQLLKAILPYSFDNQMPSSPNFDTVASNEKQKDQSTILKKSKFAYVTLIHGMEQKTYSYRGYLFSAIVAATSLKSSGSKADFIVMYGYSSGSNPHDPSIQGDLNLLQSFGIITYELPRLTPTATDTLTKKKKKDAHRATATLSKVSFLEMALLKITPFNFTQYERIQYIDGDVFPHRNMDCYFSLGINTFNTGNASPLNSGWFLAVPSRADFEAMRQKAIDRMARKWNETAGWGRVMPADITYRGGRNKVMRWDFNGASLDQGLFFDSLVLQKHSAQLVDVSTTHDPAHYYSLRPNRDTLACCKGLSSVQMFHHFTGHSKPWLQPAGKQPQPNVLAWMKQLDALHLSVNSSTISTINLKPPLGFFYPNK